MQLHSDTLPKKALPLRGTTQSTDTADRVT